MPHRAPLFALLLAFCLGAAPLRAYDPPTTPAPRPFRYGPDHFAFANETVWNYVGGQHQEESRSDEPRYTRRCFVVVRAAVQFWKFARFEPSGKPLPPKELADRIRQVADIDVWKAPRAAKDRIVFPGYPDLHALSAAFPAVFEENMGLGWPIYFRFGNLPISFYVSRGLEEQVNKEVFGDLAQGYPTILWLYNFPSLSINHAVVVFSGKKEKDRYVYQVYDPNYVDVPKRLEFDAATKTFSYQKTFYFPGGPIEARPVYRGMFH